MAKKSEKPVMLGARISPKAQYGLRLLAKIQDRTIADAVEWSINLAMRSTRLATGMRLANIVDRVWELPSEARRVSYLNDLAPELLDFEQRSAWNLVSRCSDLWRTSYYTTSFDEESGEHRDEEVASDYPNITESREEPRFDLIEQHWDTLVRVAAELVQAGDLETTFTLDEIVGGNALQKSNAN